MGEGRVDGLYPARRGGHGGRKKEVASPVDGGPGQSTAEGTWVARTAWTVIDVIAIGALSLAALSCGDPGVSSSSSSGLIPHRTNTSASTYDTA